MCANGKTTSEENSLKTTSVVRITLYLVSTLQTFWHAFVVVYLCAGDGDTRFCRWMTMRCRILGVDCVMAWAKSPCCCCFSGLFFVTGGERAELMTDDTDALVWPQMRSTDAIISSGSLACNSRSKPTS